MKLMKWLLSGDPSIQYLCQRDLLDADKSVLDKLQIQMQNEGDILKFLTLQNPQTFEWEGVYSCKWISTHYTLLELKDRGYDPHQIPFQKGVQVLLNHLWYNFGRVMKTRYQDLCVSAMLLNLAVLSGSQDDKIKEIVDYILKHQYLDGGWNCRWHAGDMHSSLHTTISVLEAFRDYLQNDYSYRKEDILNAIPKGEEFILRKELFKSEHTKEVIHPKMMLFSFPVRWQYDLFRGLDYFQSVKHPWDERMRDAFSFLLHHCDETNKYKMQQARNNKIHFTIEKNGTPSRFNTHRALRIIKFYDYPEYLRRVS